ncbi:hypothetical protein MYSE111917_20745 [Mycobacterium senriense]
MSAPALFWLVNKPSSCGFIPRRRRRPWRPDRPESRQWTDVPPGARDHGFIAACRACRIAGQTPGQHRRSARPPVLTPPWGLEAAWWPRIRASGHPKTVRRAPGSGEATRGGVPQVTRGSLQQTNEGTAGIRHRNGRPGRLKGRDDATSGGGHPSVPRGRTIWGVIKVNPPEQMVNSGQPPRAAALLGARDRPARRARAGDDGCSLPRYPGEMSPKIRTRGLKLILIP